MPEGFAIRQVISACISFSFKRSPSPTFKTLLYHPAVILRKREHPSPITRPPPSAMDENRYKSQNDFEGLPLETEAFLKEEKLPFLVSGRKSSKSSWVIVAHLTSLLLSLSLLTVALKIGFDSSHCSEGVKEVYKNISVYPLRGASAHPCAPKYASLGDYQSC